uniref:Uncharacterized protein LOC114340043 n=1 Tax=Diabrotica virgifera virgifera TaxID=50390 RepID=A0A6P7GB59_DIAVI
MKFIFLLFSLAVVSARVPLVPQDHRVNHGVQHGVNPSWPDFPPEACFLPVDQEPCIPDIMGIIPVWRWDVLTNRCVKDWYRVACTRTRNNFATATECGYIAGLVCGRVGQK